MRYPLSPQNRESGRVSSLRSTWEGKSPVNKSRRTVLPSEVRSKEKSRAKQSWRSSSAGGQENSSSVPAWRATSDKRTPVKHQQQQQSWKSSSSSNHRVSTSLSPVPGPRLNSPGRIASPGSASKALSARTNDFIRKWQTIGSTEADASAHDVYGSSPKETIGSSVPKTEVYRSQNEPNSPAARSQTEPDSPATLDMTYSVDDSIPPIKMSDTADSPSMNQLRNVLKSTPNDEKKYQTSNDEKKNQVVQEEQKMQVEEDDEDDEESLYNVDQSVASRSIASRSNASSSLVYSLEDTIPSVAHSRKSKESLKSVMERLKETASSASQSSHDDTESRCSSGLNAVDLVASTLAECRLLLQMSPPPTPLTVNVFKEPRKEQEAEDEDSDRAIQEAPSADDSEASDDSLSKLLRCPCCSHKFDEAGEHEPLHSFACEHIICKECVFDSKQSKSVPCPECGEEGAFNKSKPLVSKSYLRLIKKMGDSASVKSKKTNNERFKDSPMSVPSQINFGSHGKNSNDEISVFSSVSGQIHTAKLANRYRELAKQIDVDNVSVLSMSKPNRPPSVKSSFTINPKQDDVLSQMSESHCVPAGYSKPPMHSDSSTVQEAESVMSHSRCNTSSNASSSVKSVYSGVEVDDLKETSMMPPQEPSTPVSRAEFKFLQRKQRLAESLEKVNKVLAKTKNKSMGRICEEASVASSRISAEESSLASVVSSNRAANSVALMKQSETPFPVQDEEMTHSTADSSAAASAKSIESKEQQERNANARENKNRFKNQLRVDTGEDKNRFKDQLRVDTGHQPSPLLVHNVQPSPEPICSAQPIKEETQAEKCSPCESAKSKNTVVSDFNPFGDDPFADNEFGGDNVFRGDDIPVVGFGNFIQEPTSSSDTEHEGAFLLPQEKDTRYKEQTQAAENDLQQLSDANQCAQFLPALNVSRNGFIDMDDSPSARNGKNMKKRVKKKQQQYASAKPQKFTQKVFKPFGRSFEEASNTSGLNNTNSSANQDWRFQETLPKPPSIESSDDDETQNAPLYEFSEGSCSHSPTDFVDIKSSLDTLVTHKKGLRGKIRDKMKKVGNKRFEL